MNMKIAAVAMAACLATAANAQSNFTGWSLGGNLNFMTSTTELGDGSDNIKFGDTAQTVSLQAAYGIDLGSKFVLGIGGTYNLSKADAGGFSLAGDNLSYKFKNLYTLYVEPGYVAGTNTLLYGKLAYAGVKGEETFNGSTFSENFSGVGYGAGARQMLDKNLYVQVEFLQVDFSSKNVQGASYKPSATTANVGIGWKF